MSDLPQRPLLISSAPVTQTPHIRRRYQTVRAVLQNAMVTATLIPFVAIIAATGVLFYRDTALLMSAFGLYFVVYILAHRALFNSKFAHDVTRASK